MATRPHEVTVSIGLLEKLAGLRKKEPPKPVAPRPQVQLPLRSPISPDAARLLALDKQISRQLHATKEVSGLLLKHEETELALVGAKAAELLREYSLPSKTPPCQSEARACADCFREHSQEAWRCAAVAEAYRRCSNQAFSPGPAATATAATAAAAAVARG
ncbi:hypothetical protein PLESTB_001400900 [Pleodorina starrii]|uniref:Uncharacterized protein n=1 Tax=Pleodorina starrii TaxID=330485 RepID=A0A9W6F7L8_9CHLO|nr:hypothetical protein PLESTM_000531900 [Pleodorina starrii]GLC58785.1 hypothetical protein PLESTB_001400900 [Pleodorina starrii]GLC68718.1 hypothetical protein PLESTF_000727800 [Pleodorina starrii]